MLFGVLAMAVYAAGNFGQARLVKDIIDGVLTPAPDNVKRIIVLLLGTYFIKGVGTYASSYLMTDVGQRVVRDLRTRLYAHILNQSAAFFSAWTSGQLMSRISNDVSQIQTAASETIADLFRESLTVVGLAAWLFYLDANLAVISIAVVPLVVYPLVRLGQRVRATTRRGQDAGFRIGQNVTHPKFGAGVVVDAEGDGSDARVQVNFGRQGVKWLAVSVAKLLAA